MRFIFHFLLIITAFTTGLHAQDSSDSCLECHATGKNKAAVVAMEMIDKSVHEGSDCVECHEGVSAEEHKEKPPQVNCGICHEDVAATYRQHGMSKIFSTPHVPGCTSCHGEHDILSSSDPNAKTHPTRIMDTCGSCHEDPEVISDHPYLPNHPVKTYQSSVHIQVKTGEADVIVSCTSCHGVDGSAHQILPKGDLRSSINHFAISKTCGACHDSIGEDYRQGIHGQLMQRGETTAPTCVDCHGEHRVLSPQDDRSSVSPGLLTESTCNSCHQSPRLLEKNATPDGEAVTYIDPYHGLKSKSAKNSVANCSSCHQAHRILPQSDRRSSIHPDNIKGTCRQCHSDMSDSLAQIPIHHGDGFAGQGWPLIFKIVYVVLITLTITGMLVYILLDLGRKIRNMTQVAQTRRMTGWDILQHTLLLLTFVVLVSTGFALRFSDSWWAELLFGKTSMFTYRSAIHQTAGVLLVLTSLIHLFYLRTVRGREFLNQASPKILDFKMLWQMLRYNIGRSPEKPSLGKFSYIEKLEYWALIWGVIIMSATGIALCYENSLVKYLSHTVLDVVHVIHYYEAWLAMLSILIWHLYTTVFNPDVYPMNLSWLTGKTPKNQFEK